MQDLSNLMPQCSPACIPFDESQDILRQTGNVRALALSRPQFPHFLSNAQCSLAYYQQQDCDGPTARSRYIILKMFGL